MDGRSTAPAIAETIALDLWKARGARAMRHPALRLMCPPSASHDPDPAFPVVDPVGQRTKVRTSPSSALHG